jgi:hypothetical protein
MFPMTLFTRTSPATLQPSEACSWMWSAQCSSTHYTHTHVSESCTLEAKIGAAAHLVDPSRVAKTPAPSLVRLTDGIARVAAPIVAFGSFPAKARAAIPGRALFVQFVNVVPELTDLRARDGRSCGRETGFGDVMGDVALDLPGYIHQVEG